VPSAVAGDENAGAAMVAYGVAAAECGKCSATVRSHGKRFFHGGRMLVWGTVLGCRASAEPTQPKLNWLLMLSTVRWTLVVRFRRAATYRPEQQPKNGERSRCESVVRALASARHSSSRSTRLIPILKAIEFLFRHLPSVCATQGEIRQYNKLLAVSN